jgi:hypothetical protein
MWGFVNDGLEFKRFFSFSFPEVFTWGKNDKAKREIIRSNAVEGFPTSNPYKNFVFLITINGRINRNTDIDNIPKLIVDSFSRKLIDNESQYPNVALYPDDNVEHVVGVAVSCILSSEKPQTTVEIYGKL